VARLGIPSLDTDVLVCDRGGVVQAARVWWVLSYYGFTRVRVLNGGWAAFAPHALAVHGGSRAARLLQFGALEPRGPPPPLLKLTAHADVLATDRDVKAASDAIAAGRGDVQILDVRSEGEWSGTERRNNRRGGHVPGAVHLPHTRLFDGPSLRPASQLAELFERAGLKHGRPVITYCQAGVRAALVALALQEAGYARTGASAKSPDTTCAHEGLVRNYDGSMQHWMAQPDDTHPIV